MDCATSWWHQYPASPEDGPSCCHTYGVYIGNAPWRASDLLTLSSAWSRMFCPGPGHCRQIGVTIWVAAPWPVPVLLWATPWDPWGSMPPASISSGAHKQTLPRSLLGDHWWYLIGRCDLANNCLDRDSMGWALRFLRQIGTQEDPRYNSP